MNEAVEQWESPMNRARMRTLARANVRSIAHREALNPNHRVKEEEEAYIRRKLRHWHWMRTTQGHTFAALMYQGNLCRLAVLMARRGTLLKPEQILARGEEK